MSPWYVLRVKPRCEKIAAGALRFNGMEQFVATYTETRQWSDRRRKVDVHLFPGYLFCRFDRQQQLQVLRTPGVVSIVGFGNTPAAVPEDEIASIRAVVASGLPARSCPYLRAGVRVRIKEGCLAGVCGILMREKATLRVIVSVTILQRSVEVELDRAMISACVAEE